MHLCKIPKGLENSLSSDQKRVRTRRKLKFPDNVYGRPSTPKPPCVTFRRVVVSLRGPGRSPVLPFACCVGLLLSVGRCGRCSCWCHLRVRGAQWLPPPPPWALQSPPSPREGVFGPRQPIVTTFRTVKSQIAVQGQHAQRTVCRGAYPNVWGAVSTVGGNVKNT